MIWQTILMGCWTMTRLIRPRRICWGCFLFGCGILSVGRRALFIIPILPVLMKHIFLGMCLESTRIFCCYLFGRMETGMGLFRIIGTRVQVLFDNRRSGGRRFFYNNRLMGRKRCVLFRRVSSCLNRCCRFGRKSSLFTRGGCPGIWCIKIRERF